MLGNKVNGGKDEISHTSGRVERKEAEQARGE